MKALGFISSGKRKLAYWFFGLLAFYAVVGFLILPPIIRSVAVKQISRQLDREVSIQKIKINPFVLSVTVDGLLIKDKDGEPFVSWDEVYVNLQLSSFFGHAWVFKEISTTKPFVRLQMNQDGTFNFSDLIKKFSVPDTVDVKKESRPLVLSVKRLHIGGALAACADFTTHTPFKRTLGPLDITLENFSTDPANQNPYSFAGTTDAGERIAWSGFFYLNPLRSQGRLTLDNLTLNKYAALYQDLVRFEIRSGMVGLNVNYQFELSPTNRIAIVKDASFTLQNLKVAERGATNDIMELPFFSVNGAGVDLGSHQATVNSVLADGSKLLLTRGHDKAINVVELSKPAVNANAPGGIVFLLRSVTNAVALLLDSTNQWQATVHSVTSTNGSLYFEDNANSRPVKVALTDITLTAKDISNLAGTDFTSTLSLRWNKDGSLKTETIASFSPPTFEVKMDLDQINLGVLDPYLEPKLNLLVFGSELGLHGTAHLRTPLHELPTVTFHGDASLDDFRAVDSVSGDDLLKWDSVRVNGIHVNLNPPKVTIKQIAVINTSARLVIETNHNINLFNALHLTKTNSAVASPPPTNAAPKNSSTSAPSLPQIAINEIVISNTALSFTDHSVQPEVNLTVEQVNGSIAGLSSEQLQHADLNLSAKVDAVGPAEITGTINPFSQQLTNVLKISLRDMDLTPLSPYVSKFAGYRLAEGKLDLDLAYELIGKKLQSKNVITIGQFTFGEKVESPEATHLPVRLAVAILKDRDGKIVLDVPIEGSLDDPKFRIGKVVTRAIVNILEKVATSPFSLLGAAFGGGGEELGYQDFTPGSAELSLADKQKLDSLAKGLFAHPGLQLEISGSVAAAADSEGLQRATLDHEIRTRLWRRLRESERATNTVDQIALAPEARVHWLNKIYAEALASGKITPVLVSTSTNLPAFTTQNKLVPPPSSTEAVLLSTCTIGQGDLETLAAQRAKVVEDYLSQTGKVEAARLFLTSKGTTNNGSRAYLQFR